MIIDIISISTKDTKTLNIFDNSNYIIEPETGTSYEPFEPILTISIPGFNTVVIPFIPSTYNIIDSVKLGLTETGTYCDLPDGYYTIIYSVSDVDVAPSEITFMRIEKLYKKYYNAFMKLDFLMCDLSIKKQAKEDLSTIYFYVQGIEAAANNCAVLEANQLYAQAIKLLNSFLKKDCGCNGINYN